MQVWQIDWTSESLLAQLFNENNLPIITRYFCPFPLNASSAKIIANYYGQDRYYLAIKKNQAVGFFMLRGWDEGFNIPSFGVMVDHRYQGQGIGRLLTKEAIVVAQELACPAIRLTVFASNKVAYSLYQKLGFVEIQRSPIVVYGEDDEKIVMKKILEQLHG